MPTAERRLLALGDSYTIGEGVPARDAWPAQLCRALTAAGFAFAAPTVLARTGWTTDELLAALDAAPPAPGYDLVTLQIGVNDQYRGRSLAQFGAGFDRLLARAIDLARGAPARVLAVSIPDWSVTPFAAQDARTPPSIAEAIDACNHLARQQAVQAGVAWAEVTSISRQAGAGSDMLVADALHPSATQYTRWVESALLPAARALLLAH